MERFKVELDTAFPPIKGVMRVSEHLVLLSDIALSEEGRGVDQALSAQFKAGEERTARERALRLYQERQEKLGIGINETGMNAQIRFAWNKICWGYGPVAFLISHPRRDKVLLGQANALGEAWSLTPFENDGRFFSVDIQTFPDLFLLGPREILQPFEEKYKDRIIYIEDLSPSEREFFRLPKL